MLTEKQKMNYRSLTDLAKALGVPYGTLYSRFRTGFPRPTHTVNGVGRWKLYTKAEFDDLLRQYQENKS